MSWARKINKNGWKIRILPDFQTTMDNDARMQKILPNAEKAREKVIEKINYMCRNPPSKHYPYPKAGGMKWLEGSKIPIVEIRIPSTNNDYRLLYDVIRSGEITIFCLGDHKMVEKFVRDAAARVHNAPMDKFIKDEMLFLKGPDYEVDLESEKIDDEEKKAQINSTKNNLKKIHGREIIEDTQAEFIATADRCSIYVVGEYGLELKTSKEQDKKIELSSPLLLPGVAGTGKSTVLQQRYVNTLLSAYENNKLEMFFGETIFLTFNKKLARQTREILKPLVPDEAKEGIERTVISLEVWAKGILRAYGVYDDEIDEHGYEYETYNENNRLTFRIYRSWWRKKLDLRRFDPAQAWEELRGVIRGSVESLETKNGYLKLEEYLKLPSKRTVYNLEEREEFYKLMIEPFIESLRKTYWDDQTLFQEIIKHENFTPIYRNIFIDEVQDLTEIQLRTLLDLTIKNEKCVCNGKKYCKCQVGCSNCDCIIFDATGDISQQVYPSKFRWEDTKKLIYEQLGIKCHLADPLNTSYRSVRSIVDLANWYLEQMDERNRITGHVIEEALTTEAGIKPSILFNENEEDFIENLIEFELPMPHCPLIVRDEVEKERVTTLMNKKIKKEKGGFNQSVFIFTIAEVKGLEFNYIITWDF